MSFLWEPAILLGAHPSVHAAALTADTSCRSHHNLSYADTCPQRAVWRPPAARFMSPHSGFTKQLLLTPAFWAKQLRFLQPAANLFCVDEVSDRQDKNHLGYFSLPTSDWRMLKDFISFTPRILLISSLTLFSPKASFLICSCVMVIFYICSEDKLQLQIALLGQSFALCPDGTTHWQ